MYSDSGEQTEVDNNKIQLGSVTKLESEAEINEASNMVEDAAQALSTSNEKPPTIIKVEAKEQKEDTPAKPELSTDEHEKTLQALKSHPRKMLRQVGDTITTLKEMFEASESNRYAAQICADVKAMLPKFKDNFGKVENCAFIKRSTQRHSNLKNRCMPWPRGSISSSIASMRLWDGTTSSSSRKKRRQSRRTKTRSRTEMPELC